MRELNELVEELADKALENLPGAWHISDEFLEKFSGLIIEECVKQIEDAIPDTWCSAHPAYKTAKIAAIACIQHKFGV